ncbi:hypothetical protein ACFL50_05005 [Candidatus Latescibacterota bacterium]
MEKTLMCGSSPPGFNPFMTVPLTAKVFAMYARYISNSDMLDQIPLDSHWNGPGDNIRIVAG